MRERAKTAPLSRGDGKKTIPRLPGDRGKQSPYLPERRETISLPLGDREKKNSLYLPREMGNEAYHPFPSVEIEKKKFLTIPAKVSLKELDRLIGPPSYKKVRL